MRPRFAKTNNSIIELSEIAEIDCSRLEKDLWIAVLMKNGSSHVATDIRALELIMQACPSMLEGKKGIKFPRFMWAIHNLIGHPLMQILSFFKCYTLAFKVHDSTVPTPTIYKQRQ